MGWVSPTGFVDPDEKWTNEVRAYDDNITTYAYNSAWPYDAYLELTHAALDCDKIQFMMGSYDTRDMEFDVYYGSAWHNIYSGTPAKDIWIESSIGSTESVTAVRLRCTNDRGPYLKEFDFNEVEAPPPTYIPKVIGPF